MRLLFEAERSPEAGACWDLPTAPPCSISSVPADLTAGDGLVFRTGQDPDALLPSLRRLDKGGSGQ
ncbi:hypothetical protein GCM10010211_77710 [Streptomyces albospinus]|uniref:Uncharacterized protein n=1 Tax=Streptomyces albospinus TaxID=285515 RepID=A0ABQ2VM98_9ACTN|nr:hypothetical protein GCM10010211_77710 [Streptomyces albospinus]